MTDTIDKYCGAETILVVEDDKRVRSMLYNFFSTCGYNPILAKDGQEATEQYELLGDSIHLVIMDVVMPRKDGITAYWEIKKSRPDAAIFLMSANCAEYLHHDDGLDIIAKPFSLLDMAKKTRKTLDNCFRAA